ncbi:hypothetical protein [Glutamicibacter sp. NPDC087344]|uniref:hypothetical protein n=1 Tax=Glutamicibacter sp. NPDC087344 TaxID=3363994 RepID=UPI003819274E
MNQDEEFSIENPEGTNLERLWQGVVLEFPFYGGNDFEQRAMHKVLSSRRLASGRLNDLSDHMRSYIARWIAVGFTPELYWAVSSSVLEATESARRCSKGPEDSSRLEDRLHRLGILAPNPRAGKYYKRLMHSDGPPTLKDFVDCQYPDHVVQLEPEEWADFPRYMLFGTPSAAVREFIYGDPGQ